MSNNGIVNIEIDTAKIKKKQYHIIQESLSIGVVKFTTMACEFLVRNFV